MNPARSAVMEPLTLRRHGVKLVLDPVNGAAIREFTVHEAHVFRPTPSDARSDPFSFSCFPMAPYANRVYHGRFRFLDRDVHLTRNWSGDPHPLHGQAWRSAWQVAHASPSNAVLTFDGGNDDWPWPYRCKQTFVLLKSGLRIGLSIENLSSHPMPAMIGLHPYFPHAVDARLCAVLPRVWRTQANLSVECVRTTGWTGAAREVKSISLDHSFSSWNGKAQIQWPQRTLQIEAINCGHLHVYTPADRDFFCIEPQTAAAGALNRAPREFTILESRKHLAIQVDFIVGEA